MKRKTVSLILASAVLTSMLAACSSSSDTSVTTADNSASGVTNQTSAVTTNGDSAEDSDSSTESSASDGTASADDIMSPYGKYPEQIELHTAKRASSAPNFAEGEDVENNAMNQYILDKLNVKVKIDWEVESSEFANKLSLMIASNDLPDMFTLGAGDYLIYRQLVDNGLLADLSEAYEECAGDYMIECFESFDYKNLDPFKEGDALYAIAGGRYGYEHNQLWLRKDWLDKAGITEMPETIEDIENILTIWRDNPPVENYTGMILNATTIAGGYSSGYSADPIFNAFGAAPCTWVRDPDGNIVYGSVMPEMKEGLAVLADWYAKGLIDKQFATRTASGATDALFTGSQSGAAFVPWWYCYTIADLPRNDSEAEVIMVNAPLDSEGNFNIEWPGPSGDYVMVRKDYEYPEAVVKVLNCEYDMWRGFDEEAAEKIQPDRDANVDWGYMFATSGVNLEFADVIPQVGILAKNYVEEGKMESDSVVGDIPSNQLMASEAKEYAETKSLDGTLWLNYTGRYMASSPDLMLADNIKKIEPVFSYTTESMADLKPNLDTLEKTTFLKIVMGELPVDAFDQFVEDWYAQGGQTMTDEVKALVDG